MHILITGAAGMIGRKLTARLVSDGALNGRAIERLTLFDVSAPPRPEKFAAPVEMIGADVTDAKALGAAIADRPDVIFHLAAIVSGEAELDFDKGMRVNFDGSRTLLELDPRGRRPLLPAGRIFILDRGLRRAVPGGDRR